MNLRAFLRHLLPPVVLKAFRRRRNDEIRFTGDYASWDHALLDSASYDRQDIVARISAAELKVRRGEAADERDGVTFGEMQYSFPVLAVLCSAAARAQGKMHVVDFGGALGRNYRHYKSFLGAQSPVAWSVVELPAFVAAGKAGFESDELRFFSSIAETRPRGQPSVVLLCSVLQYVEDPYRLVAQLSELRADYIVIDRTPCSDLERDILAVQEVPETIYPARYPCWIFSRARLSKAFAPRYHQAATFRDASGPWQGSYASFELDGFVLDRAGAP